ncbi:MAG: hypothetical protein HY719_11925 [Planctomycetes bacterium]|nr:hypothetical protein [Planctomycetota bacterium]
MRVHSWRFRSVARVAVAVALIWPAAVAFADPPDNIDRAVHFRLIPPGEASVSLNLTVRERLAPRFRARMDGDGDGFVSAAEGAAFTRDECARIARAMLLTVDGQPLAPRVAAARLSPAGGATPVDLDAPLVISLEIRAPLPGAVPGSDAAGEPARGAGTPAAAVPVMHVWEMVDRYFALTPGVLRVTYDQRCFGPDAWLTPFDAGGLRALRLSAAYRPPARWTESDAVPGRAAKGADGATVLLPDPAGENPGLVATDDFTAKNGGRVATAAAVPSAGGEVPGETPVPPRWALLAGAVIAAGAAFVVVGWSYLPRPRAPKVLP